MVALRHALPPLTTEEGDIGGYTHRSSSAAEAMENFERFHGKAEDIGSRTFEIDTPVPSSRALPTSASRLRLGLHAPTGDSRTYGYDFTTYKPVEDPDAIQPLHFRADNIRHQIFIRNHAAGDMDNFEVRTAVQTETDTRLGTKTYLPLGTLQNVVTIDAPGRFPYALPELTRQEEQIYDLGTRMLTYCQLRQDLSIMSELAGQDPARPMGIY